MVPTIEGEFARKRRMMSHRWPIVLRGGMLSPRGYDPLYALMIVSHRILRYAVAVPAPDRAGREHRVCSGRGGCTWWRWRSSSRVLAAALLARRGAGEAAADRPLLRADDRVARRRPVGLAAPRHGGGLGAGGGDAVTPSARSTSLSRCSASVADRPARRRCSRLAIRLESRGHPIYTQTRVGKDGAPFQIYKLRTMVHGAEFTGAGLAIQEGDDADHAARQLPAPLLARRAAEPVERAARRDVDRRPATDAAGPGRAVHASASAAGSRSSPGSPAGPRSTAARRCRGPSGSSSTSGTSSTARCGST